MTDAPERICAWVYRDGNRMHHNWRGDDFPRGPWQTEYVRADLATPLNDPRVEALMKKARAVVDRWDSPLWKDLPHTGESIADLRAAISALEENK